MSVNLNITHITIVLSILLIESLIISILNIAYTDTVQKPANIMFLFFIFFCEILGYFAYIIHKERKQKSIECSAIE